MTKIKINWPFALKKLIKQVKNNPEKDIPADYLAQLHFQANDWPTCACGVLCPSELKSVDGSPKDSELRNLGMMFGQFVYFNDWQGALDCYNEISTYLTEKLKG